MFTLNLKRCKMVKDKWRSICVIVPLTNKSGKLKFNVKSIIPMERLAYWYKIACEIQRTISYFLQTLLKVVTQLCLALCDPMDWSLPGSSIHGIFRARVLEWVAISFSRGSSRPRDPTQVSHIVGSRFYHLSHQGVERREYIREFNFSIERGFKNAWLHL